MPASEARQLLSCFLGNEKQKWMNSYISSTEHKGLSILNRKVCFKELVKTNKNTHTN